MKKKLAATLATAAIMFSTAGLVATAAEAAPAQQAPASSLHLTAGPHGKCGTYSSSTWYSLFFGIWGWNCDVW